jgi:peptide deformylase
MKRKLINIPNSVLRMKSKRIGFVDNSIRDLAEEMIATTLEYDKESEIGAALAAVQIGEPLRMTVVRDDYEGHKDEEFSTYINPEIVKSSGEMIEDVEGCMSVAGIYGKVKRHLKIKVKAQDLDGNEVRLTLEGFPARVFQHEIDHMNGIIFLDHITDPSKLLAVDKNGQLKPMKEIPDDIQDELSHNH